MKDKDWLFEAPITPDRTRKIRYGYFMIVFFERYAIWIAMIGVLFYISHLHKSLIESDLATTERVKKMEAINQRIEGHIIEDSKMVAIMNKVNHDILLEMLKQRKGH